MVLGALGTLNPPECGFSWLGVSTVCVTSLPHKLENLELFLHVGKFGGTHMAVLGVIPALLGWGGVGLLMEGAHVLPIWKPGPGASHTFLVDS